jgi:hypothetical protein
MKIMTFPGSKIGHSANQRQANCTFYSAEKAAKDTGYFAES